MLIRETSLDGVFVVSPERLADDRGSFARTFCELEFAKLGLKNRFVQSSVAVTKETGTLRGVHYQKSPHWETKLVRCTRGKAFVVAVDLRPESSNHKGWVGIELSEVNGDAVYVPEGFAQGYQTLEDETEILYQMTEFYVAELAAGYRYDDPAFGIEWPMHAKNLSEKDQNWSLFA